MGFILKQKCAILIRIYDRKDLSYGQPIKLKGKNTVGLMQLDVLLRAAGMLEAPSALDVRDGADITDNNDVKYNIEITEICNDSRRAGEGALFVCIKGAQTDGHIFARAVYSHGCRAFVVSEDVDLPSDAAVVRVDDTRAALADLAAAFYGFPSREIGVIGITGTKGKTTTALMTAHILERAGIPAGYIGTSGISFAGRVYPTVNTTPESLELQRRLREMADAGVRTVVMEVSSQGLYMDRVRGICFDTVCFTNFSPDHIGGAEHPTLEHYAACKRRLFTDYNASAAVYNADDDMSEYMISNFGGQKISYSARSSGADISLLCSNIERRGSRLGVAGRIAQLCGRELDISLPLPGEFNIMNAMCAIAAAGTLGVGAADAAAALTDVKTPGRLEVVDVLPELGATFVVDYAHNGLALTSVLKTLRRYAPHRLICLFGSVGGRTQTRRHELGEAASLYADFCILTADNPDFEDPRSVIADIAAAFRPGASCDHVAIPDRTEAVRYAVSIAEAGDIVLLAGKGAEDFQLVNGRREPYSDTAALIECAAEHRVKVEI